MSKFIETNSRPLQADQSESVMRCAAHPDVETELSCSRCGTAICPRCLVYTPVGARCRNCARVQRVPTYHLSMQTYLRALAAALAVGVGAGVIWWLAIPFTFGFFFGIIAGLLLGYVTGEAVSNATNLKRGVPLQAIAAGGIVVAYLVRNTLVGAPLIPIGDLFGYIVVGVAIMMAISRLR